jgi:hypothetical protein
MRRLNRREWLKVSARALATLAATGLSSAAEAAAARTLLVKVTKAGTVAAITQRAFLCSFDPRYNKRLFTKVGSLRGNLQFYINGRLMFAAASACIARAGDTITWRLV